ncbi:3'-5' exonuclease [Shewanella sp. MTB7]|uniref:3'-5' exonuclease n=1 Tax=Shewanella sp. MTB7 TaxID=2746932 RepID=UPI0022BA6D72|nr:3'-5' exonuclease [Shewanella sp. MTB7]WBJ95299.1 3'-5' exonuclease [Shewanella sp. MTB7]
MTTCESNIESTYAVEIAKKWISSNAIILDTETTGLEWGCEVVEVAAIELATGNILMNTLVRPTQQIPDDIIAIHGITNDMVENAPEFNLVLIDLLEATLGREIVAWNASFDLKLLLSTLHITMPFTVECQLVPCIRQHSDNTNRWHCAMLNYAQFGGDWNNAYGEYKWHSLDNAAKQMGIELPSTRHRALEDCQLTREVILKMAAVNNGRSPF